MIERRPELTIIAGPNGAGKSRLCPLYVSKASFDGDKLMMSLRKAHPEWPDRCFNFNEGLAKIKQNLHLFENLNFIDGIPEYGRTIALHIEKGHIHRVEDNPPLWFREQFEEAFNSLSEQHV